MMLPGPRAVETRGTTWSEYTTAFDKKYDDAQGETPESIRSALFRQARRYINSMNRRNLSYKLEVNHIAD